MPKKTKHDIEKALIATANHFLAELGTEMSAHKIRLDTDLERELGIDSIKKVELFHRIEKTFHLSLPDALLLEAATLGDLVAPILAANPTVGVTTRSISQPMAKASYNPNTAASLVDALYGYTESDPQRTHIIFQDDAGEESIITYQDLLQNAETVAACFQAYGIKPNETCAIMLPTSKAFFYTFFGLLLIGAIPVPIYPPFRPDQIEEYVSRSILILRSAGIRLLITFDQATLLSKQLKPFIPSLMATLTFEQLLQRQHHDYKRVTITDQHPALIQYTSGSTGNPKGVLLHHANLLSNLRAAGDAFAVTENDVVVSWLPLYHDMGLIGKWLGSLYYGVPASIMPPQSFLARPERWLWNIHYHRGSISAAPNFAYGYCTQKIPAHAIEGLDLSSWRIAANGAEAVDPDIFRAFYARFAQYGLNEKAPTAVYGLAESTVALSFSSVNEVQTYDCIDRGALESDKQAINVERNHKGSLELASCGQVIPGHALRIVDDHDNPLPERHVGLIQFKGPSSLVAYYNNDAATEAIKHGPWYQTGDLGYIGDGHLYITGRKKDLIIKAGRNISPETIEEATSQVADIRKSCVIAFGINDRQTGTEQVVIVAEMRKNSQRQKKAIRDDIRQVISRQLGDPPDKIILVMPGTIPKTSSGKLRRATCKQDYLAGKLGQTGAPLWWQLTKIISKSYGQKMAHLLTIIARMVYTAYVALLFSMVIIPLWLLIIVLPKDIAAITIHYVFRVLLVLAGMPVTRQHADRQPNTTPIVFVANHASYLDSIILMAYLPTNAAFIAKREVLRVPILATFIKKMDHITVQRENKKDRLSVLKQAHALLKTDKSIIVFPEGGILSPDGIHPFKSGAFAMAAERQCPLCPISIHGTRRILRANNVLLRPGRITLTYQQALRAKNNTWAEINRLKTEARRLIGRDSGEQLR